MAVDGEARARIQELDEQRCRGAIASHDLRTGNALGRFRQEVGEADDPTIDLDAAQALAGIGVLGRVGSRGDGADPVFRSVDVARLRQAAEGVHERAATVEAIDPIGSEPERHSESVVHGETMPQGSSRGCDVRDMSEGCC